MKRSFPSLPFAISPLVLAAAFIAASMVQADLPLQQKDLPHATPALATL